MNPDDGTEAGHEAEPSIEVELRTDAATRFAAVVMLRGEHDIATAPAVGDAIGAISGNVLVDLCECSFLDSSIIRVLLATSKTLERDAHYLELVVPPNAIIARTLDIVGVRDLVVVHPSRPNLNPHEA
jgi:anti-anti-sigma factor